MLTMANIAKHPRGVKEAKRQPSYRSWQSRKLSTELDSSAEISHQFNSLCAVLQQFCADQATVAQANFLKDRGFPLLAALEHSLRRCRILSEVRDEIVGGVE